MFRSGIGNQILSVSNWFINARVRLWKPMVEEMYQHEFHEVQPPLASEMTEPKSAENNENYTTINNIIRQGKQVVVPPSAAAEYRCFTADLEPEPGNLVGGEGNNEVSLTLGLRRSENVPRMTKLSIRDQFEDY
ncbi:hypothetical protein CASFOL_021286 [Castilleja foliolosa]|uniref:Uncharacterized protein n=1 Tax=Castilleja foliolosa TaxID=1961234 RepID=A0ABD3D087_9LAMI